MVCIFRRPEIVLGPAKGLFPVMSFVMEGYFSFPLSGLGESSEPINLVISRG